MSQEPNKRPSASSNYNEENQPQKEDASSIGIIFYTFARFQVHLQNFLRIYSSAHEQIVLYPSESMVKQLKPKRERVCRFYGLDAASTKFTHRAHAIPELLGNKYLLSDSECDTCNEFFSVLENDLANFLGAARTISNVQTKKNTPTFKSTGGELTAKKEEFYGVDGISISRKDTENETFVYNKEAGELKMSYTK